MTKSILVALWLVVCIGGISARRINEPIMATLFQEHNELEELSNNITLEHGLSELSAKTCTESIDQEFKDDHLHPYLERILLVLEQQERELIANICAAILALEDIQHKPSKSPEKFVELITEGYAVQHPNHQTQTLGKKKESPCAPKIVRPKQARGNSNDRSKTWT